MTGVLFACVAGGRAESGLLRTYAAQAAEIMLDAIARSDGTRASVTQELLPTRIEDGILGTSASTKTATS